MFDSDAIAWLRQCALPFWVDRGLSRTEGAFYERLTMDGVALTSVPRRLLVQARQLYVYSDAYRRGLYGAGLEVAARCFETMISRYWEAGGLPGFAHALDQDGTVADARRESYDHAFALFGLAAYYRANPDQRVLAAVDNVLGFLDTHLSADNLGYHENLERTLPRRQNPHMHLLEAFLALYHATGDDRHLDRADATLDLFRTHFFDRKTGFVLEYFDADWRPLSAREQRVEPGHMMEWAWLLRQYEDLRPDTVGPIASRLYHTGQEVGLDDASGLLIDELDGDGHITKSSRRCWPQTEHLKASLAQYAANGDTDARRAGHRSLDALFATYLGSKTASHPRDRDGGWRDQIDGNGRCLVDYMPTSTLYHIYCAFCFMMDVGDVAAYET